MSEAYEQSVVAEWNEVLLTAIREGGAKPTPTAYQLFLTHTAIYDAWAAYDPSARGLYFEERRPAAENTDANKIEAVSYAAYRTLSTLFPDQQSLFDDFMASLGFDPTATTTDVSDPAGVGNLASAAVFAAREGDGSDIENDFSDTAGYAAVNSPDPDADNAPGGDDFDPNRWQSLRVPNGNALDVNGNPVATDDPSTYDDQIILTPYWGDVVPFALPSGDAVRTSPPPLFGDDGVYVDGLGRVTTGDQAYRDQFTEVLETSAELTDQQKVIAEFWADGPRTESPPGHWNQFAQDLAKRDGHMIDDDAKMFFALNAAIFDASIATWDTKNFYDFVRPQSAIRHLYFDQEVEAWAGPNLGTQTILGQEWQPYQSTTFVTPPFQEYTSGHSAFSAAAAGVLARYTGTDQFYDGVSVGNYDLNGDGELDLLGEFIALELVFEDYDGPPIVLQWETLSDAADEAGVSRIFGGIHIQDGDLRGREIGDDVAEIAYAKAESLFDADASSVDIGLVDTRTDRLVRMIEDGDVVSADGLSLSDLSLVAFTDDRAVGSVMLDLNDGQAQRVENVEPFALFGDNNGDYLAGAGLQVGENALSLSLYEGAAGRGPLIASLETSFELVQDPISFGLYDADADQLIQSLRDGATVSASAVEGRSLTIAAEIDEDRFDFVDIDAVRLNLNDGEATRVERVEPYALFGDIDGDFFGGAVSVGENSLAYEVLADDMTIASGVFDFTIADELITG